VGTVAALAAVGVVQITSKPSIEDDKPQIPDPATFPRIPPRQEQLSALRDPANKFDVLIIGGGASGAGSALDAASRGLKVALVERDDFAGGTSSRSTKLVHGGVRYLEKAFRVYFIHFYANCRNWIMDNISLLERPYMRGKRSSKLHRI
jgi:glycerol-3-phosphate dehydrogenase